MSYSDKGKIPEKYYLNVYEVITDKSYKQQYFSGGDVISNKDFEKLNEERVGKKQAEIVSTETSSGKKGYKRSNEKTEKENVPVKLKLFGASNNSYGRYGTNYSTKVLLDNQYIVDISTDILLESLLVDGCEPSGELRSEFVVATNGTSAHFIRKGSSAYEACIKHMEELKKPTMKDFAFEYGKVYKKANGEHGVFLGYISTITNTLSFKTEKKQDKTYTSREYVHITDIDVKNRETKMASLWYTISKWTHEYTLNNVVTDTNADVRNKKYCDKVKQDVLDNLNKKDGYVNTWFKCYLANAHKFVEQTEFKIDLPSPKDVIFSLSNKYRDILNKQIEVMNKAEQDKNNNNRGLYSYRNPTGAEMHTLKDCFKTSEFVNLQVFGIKPKKDEIFNKLEKDWFVITKDNWNKCNHTYKP